MCPVLTAGDVATGAWMEVSWTLEPRVMWCYQQRTVMWVSPGQAVHIVRCMVAQVTVGMHLTPRQ